jgi:hypothetical protein
MCLPGPLRVHGGTIGRAFRLFGSRRRLGLRNMGNACASAPHPGMTAVTSLTSMTSVELVGSSSAIIIIQASAEARTAWRAEASKPCCFVSQLFLHIIAIA